MHLGDSICSTFYYPLPRGVLLQRMTLGARRRPDFFDTPIRSVSGRPLSVLVVASTILVANPR